MSPRPGKPASDHPLISSRPRRTPSCHTLLPRRDYFEDMYLLSSYVHWAISSCLQSEHIRWTVLVLSGVRGFDLG